MYTHLLDTTEAYQEAKSYWLNKFSGQLAEIELNKDYAQNQHYQPAAYEGIFDIDVTRLLLKRSKGNDLSLYVILLTAFKILIFKFTHQ
ncbi:MAG: condensation domain-containing protein, partial [Acidobacteria bacterium]|nr:condensation domain-containing protein [Acidobacteriota bacterium]